MVSGQAAIGTIIFAISMVQLANGFFGTLVSLRVEIEDFGGTLDGLTLSAYFVGYTVGAVCCGRVIERVGHIRAFAAFAGLVAGATVLFPVAVAPLTWIPLRFCVGFGAVGLFITTESWLNVKAKPSERGKAFSFYMVATFAALALGQLLIGAADITAFRPFNLIAALFAGALFIVSTTRAEPPVIQRGEHLPFGRLIREAPLAVVGCAVAGLLSGAFYTLVPAWMLEEGLDQSAISFFMFIAVMGGLIFQIPVARLSDLLDRRLVVALLAGGLAVVAIALVVLPHWLVVVFPAAVMFGGFMSTIYPVSVAHAHDRMRAEAIVGVSGRMLLVHGIASSLGPALGAVIMEELYLDGLLYFMAAVSMLLVFTSLYRRARVTESEHQPRPFGVLAPQAAHLGHSYRAS